MPIRAEMVMLFYIFNKYPDFNQVNLELVLWWYYILHIKIVFHCLLIFHILLLCMYTVRIFATTFLLVDVLHLSKEKSIYFLLCSRQWIDFSLKHFSIYFFFLNFSSLFILLKENCLNLMQHYFQFCCTR